MQEKKEMIMRQDNKEWSFDEAHHTDTTKPMGSVPNVQCVFCGEKPVKEHVDYVQSYQCQFFPSFDGYAHLICAAAYGGPNGLRRLQEEHPESPVIPILIEEQKRRIEHETRFANWGIGHYMIQWPKY